MVADDVRVSLSPRTGFAGMDAGPAYRMTLPVGLTPSLWMVTVGVSCNVLQDALKRYEQSKAIPCARYYYLRRTSGSAPKFGPAVVEQSDAVGDSGAAFLHQHLQCAV
ncbi:unnamed protein product [Clonostachys byssicola]|uniref:Uncharacterized protein n=1 Tax=Clonostachys byssicola TaxID=160290 RepID=A0A9N9XY08_9HYPO|nr:unnamed protein product [Clonostachys byssicola]